VIHDGATLIRVRYIAMSSGQPPGGSPCRASVASPVVIHAAVIRAIVIHAA
jgi:hypothetical protein